MKHALLIGILLVTLIIPLTTAQTDGEQVDTVILASTENYPDALVAGSAAAKIGAPVLLTEQDELPQETLDALNRMDPSEIVVVGGESVISNAVVTRLEDNGYSTTRLWGTTRYGTAVEVAEHFWVEGTDEAILVQNNIDDEDGSLVAAAKELARDEEQPVYLTPENSVPAVVQTSLEDLGVQSVTVVGTSVSDSYRQALTEVGVSVEEAITGDSEEDVEAQLHDRATARLNATQTMLVVASSGFRARLAASNFPDHRVFHVSDDDDVQDAVEAANEHGVTRVKVVGDPDRAASAAETLRSETDASVTLVTATDDAAAALNANLTTDEQPAFAEHSERRLQQWEERRQEHRERVQTRANKTINKADDLIDENASEEAQDRLAKARVLYSNEEYFDAMEEAREAISIVRSERLNERGREHWETVRESMEEEMESLEERVKELRELNREFAEEMEENMTAEERLEVIEEFRHERRETVQELVDEARENRAERKEDMLDRLRDARTRIRDRSTHERFRFEAECTDESADGITVAENEISGHDGKVRAKGELLLPTPNYEASAASNTADHTVDMTVTLRETDGFGVQCVGAADYRYEVDAAAGNWTVTLTVTADGDNIYTETREVTVTPDDDEREREEHEDENETVDDDHASCQDAVDAAQEHADGKMCTQQVQELECPHEDSFTYTARDGCEISYLKSEGWTAVDETEEETNDTETSDTSTDDGDTAETHTVTYTADGFDPQQLEIQQGDTVVWETERSDMWVASDQHPTHTEYHGTSQTEHCGSDDLAGERFDSCEPRDRYEFTFNQNGTWGYHNHYASSDGGTIVVE